MAGHSGRAACKQQCEICDGTAAAAAATAGSISGSSISGSISGGSSGASGQAGRHDPCCAHVKGNDVLLAGEGARNLDGVVGGLCNAMHDIK